jgi:hypothetical protein
MTFLRPAVTFLSEDFVTILRYLPIPFDTTAEHVPKTVAFGINESEERPIPNRAATRLVFFKKIIQ